MGVVELIVEFGRGQPESREIKTLFNVMDMPLAYNAIIGRPYLYDSGAVTSIRYLTMKIPTKKGVVVVKGNQEAAKKCYLTTATESLPIEEILEIEAEE